MTLLIFVITDRIPGDPAKFAAGLDATADQIEQTKRNLGLEKPLPEQYLIYLGNLAHGTWALRLSPRGPCATIWLATPSRVFIDGRELDRQEFLSRTEGFSLMDDVTVCSSEIAGGGGSGDPRQRPRDRVQHDVRNGFVSPERAASEYGLSSLDSTSGSEE